MPDLNLVRAALAAFGILSTMAIAAAPPAAAQERAAPARIVAFGDSLTAGYGLSSGDAFPAKLERALRAAGRGVTVANAGLSGDTTSRGLARVARAVPAYADLVILELGANDILRGVPPQVTERNLDAILTRLKAGGARVVLAGMIAPPQLGTAFSRSFDPIYGRLARKHGIRLYPFFLDGVAGRPALNLGDGVHPNARGVDRIVEGILPAVVSELDALSGGGKGRVQGLLD